MASPLVTPAAVKTNRIGLQILDYRGGKTTLCAGCGHNAIAERILEAFYDMGVQPERVMKMSGIGCSSKSPAYFMSRSFSFNSVHGRMPSVATGALLANKTMRSIGISGDGDTASIGLGQFVHLLRRNVPMISIIAIAHRGTVLLDVISPCVTFNDHEGSTKSYKYMQEHDETVSEIGFIAPFEDISVDYDHDTTVDVELHDGSHLRLRKIHEDYDPTSKSRAVNMLIESHEKGEILTGVFYVNANGDDFTSTLNMVDEPLATLAAERVRPGREVLAQLMQEHR
jgi:pyruvate/2-oxoacid:ferredoxin oxidoreductase beta subunit